MPMCSFFSLLSLLLLFPTADALFGHGVGRCQFPTSDGAVFLEQIYINKKLLLQYNSTLGNFTGYTAKTKDIADGLNKSPEVMRHHAWNANRCKTLIAQADFFKPEFFPRVEPYVRVRSVDAAGSRHPGMLVCSAFDFFPKLIRVTWLRNGKEVTAGVTSTEELSNGNWLYQMHSYLEFTPTPGEKISCMVEHASLMEPKFYEWEPTPESQNNKIAVGTAGLLLGLVVLVAGLFYYRKNTAGRLLVPTG